MSSPEPVFALDIGTRSIVGLLLEPAKRGYRIRAVQREEHKSRAMFCGQVHDIDAVASTVTGIRETLEKRTGLTLRKAAVAAAGRSLETGRGKAHRALDRDTPVSARDVQEMELEAVREAMKVIFSGDSFCVGYSPFRYTLDGRTMTTLKGHRGREAVVEVIATFLPRIVTDSLLSVLETAGLEVHTLTLEPIAALDVAVPRSMRTLNLALVDMGAGTSDIALSRDGTIFAYAMVPRAGDEVTEAICNACLLDFPEGERLKRALHQGGALKAKDVLGRVQSLEASSVLKALDPVASEIAGDIASAILELNGKAPDGVIMIGGGSLTPGMPEKLARALGLDGGRVGILNRESLEGISGQKSRLRGPEAVTPIGIGVWGLRHPPFTYRRITVNGRPHRLWNLEGERAGDALLLAGFAWDRLHGRIGRAVTADVNGETVTVKGEMGEPARILVNGEESDLSTPLADGDRVDFVPPKDGSDAAARLGDLLPDERKSVFINGEEVFLEPVVIVDGQEVRDLDMIVPDRAKIQTFWMRPLGRLLEEAKVFDGSAAPQKISYSLNGERKELEWPPLAFEVNGKKADASTPVGPKDEIKWQENREFPTLAEVAAMAGKSLKPREFSIFLNGKPFTLPLSDGIFMNGEPAEASDRLKPGADIRVEKAEAPVLSDLFRHYDPRGDGPGKKLIMKVNDRPASFTTPLNPGDRVTIRLEEQAG